MAVDIGDGDQIDAISCAITPGMTRPHSFGPDLVAAEQTHPGDASGTEDARAVSHPLAGVRPATTGVVQSTTVEPSTSPGTALLRVPDPGLEFRPPRLL